MHEALTQAHLLRPWWLLLLLPASLGFWWNHRRGQDLGGWRGVVDPVLLPFLLVARGRAPWLRPAPCLWVLLALAALALSGPTWRREPGPEVADRAPMMVAVEASRTAEPRLAAARRKVRDLVGLRGDGRTGLLAYAATAHLVLPPTADPGLLEVYLDALSPAVMPRDGNDPVAALAEALKQLDRQEGAGTVVLVTGRIPASQGEAFARLAGGARHAVVVLPPGAVSGGALDGARGASLITPTADTADIQAVMARAQRHFAVAPSDDPRLRWRDAGYWLALPLLPLALLWSRRGFMVLVVMMACAPPALAQQAPSRTTGWAGRLLLTPDQRGRIAFGHADYATAMALFTDPMWRGTAAYRAGDYARAVAEFSALDTPEAWFDRGNAHLMQPHEWDEALAAYDRALALRPDFPAASANRAIAAAFVAYQKALDAERARQSSDQMNEKPDDTVVDSNAPRPPERPPGNQPPQAEQGLSNEQITALWMRRVGGSPADFLRMRFARQDGAASP
jgi:Ca-activated chloride channel family protein